MNNAPILLHVGFHKTGTSSVQAALKAHRAAWSPHLHVLLRDDLGDLPALARAFSHHEAGQDAVRQAAARAFAGIDPTDSRPVILSSEDLCGSLPGRRQIRTYAAAIPLAQVLAETLRPLQRPLHFIYGTRAPGPWLRSLWWQHLRVKRPTASLPEFSETYAPAARLTDITAQVRAALPDVTLHTPALEDNTALPIAPLLRLAGLPETLWPQPSGPSNARPDHGIEEIFLALNRSALPDAFVAEQKRMILRKLDRMGRYSVPPLP